MRVLFDVNMGDYHMHGKNDALIILSLFRVPHLDFLMDWDRRIVHGRCRGFMHTLIKIFMLVGKNAGYALQILTLPVCRIIQALMDVACDSLSNAGLDWKHISKEQYLEHAWQNCEDAGARCRIWA